MAAPNGPPTCPRSLLIHLTLRPPFFTAPPMRISPFCRLPLLLVLATACQKHRLDVVTALPQSMQQLEGTWLSSYEENQGDTLVYRPNTYRFPPTRGRTGFAIKSYGRFEQFDIAPTDGLTGRPGTWAPQGLTKLRIHLANAETPDYTLEVLALEKKPKVLKLRRRP